MRFTKDHQWIELDGAIATIGISAYAAEQLGDIVLVQLPANGAAVRTGENLAVVESVKTTSDIPAPVDGEVVETNDMVTQAAEMINTAPESLGWLVKLKIADPNQVESLMDRTAYEAYLDSV